MANAKAKSADRIVEAFIAHANASWMQTLLEVRTSEPRTDHAVEVIAGFEVAVDKGRLDAGTAKVYASQVRSIYMVPTPTFTDIVGQTGGAINATMRLIAAWKREAGLGSKAGRKANQGAGKRGFFLALRDRMSRAREHACEHASHVVATPARQHASDAT
jgi:hypothetical protein